MNSKFRKFLLLAIAAALLFGVGQVQNSLNHDREALNLTRAQPLDNAPPVLAFTTVALGGFRGLISNVLWARASNLQDEDKFFEMAQLADWITKLEPHFVQVWAFQAWNMAWNISVKFKDYDDRWRWVQRGIELLRDDGLRYNPNEILLYRELAWIFQDKMGAGTDDASRIYKQHWADAMAEVFANKPANFDELINPKTDDQKRRATLLRERYKLDPVVMREVDAKYGPLEWRLPEAHAIYWAYLGLDEAQRNPDKVKKDDLLTLRRVIYQSMLLSFQRGRMEINPFVQAFDLGPNLDIIGKVNAVYEQSMAEDPPNAEHIGQAHRNFLRQAVYSLYVNARTAEAAKWYQYLADHYPNKPVLDNDPNSLPAKVPLDRYVFDSVQEDVNDLSRDRVKTAIEGFLVNHFRSVILDETDRAVEFMNLARKVWTTFQSEITKERQSTQGLPSVDVIAQEVLDQMLNPTNGVSPEARAILRSKLNLGPETSDTNAPPAASAAK